MTSEPCNRPCFNMAPRLSGPKISMFGVVFFVSKTPLGIERQKELKALVKRSLKLSQVENLGLLATPFGQVLRALALTRDDLRSLWSRSNLHTSQSKFITV